MYLIQKIEQEILQKIKLAVGKRYTPAVDLLSTPPDPKFGEIAFPVFELAKGLAKNPAEVAAEIAPKIEPSPLINKIEAAGPYINFFVDSDALAKHVLKETALLGDAYGRWNQGKGKRVMVEFAQPNTHKAVHVGHVRNFVLGQCVINLLRALGYDVIGASYHGDVGTHVATTLWGLQKFHAKDEPPRAGRGVWLGQIYAEAVQKLEENPECKKEARDVNLKLEKKDRALTKLWKETREWSIREFREIFKELGLTIDRYYYESEMEDRAKKIVADLLKKGIARESEGAVIVPLEDFGLDVFLILKSDGSTLYSTRDLALAKQKFTEYKIDRSINIVDSRQSFYFKQLFKTLELMGFKKPMSHIPYEFVTLKEGMISSRKGNIISYEDFRDAVFGAAREETKKRHNDWNDSKIDKTGRSIGMAAIKCAMLAQDVSRPIVFDISKATSFDGFTGPYLQYTAARISGILRKTSTSRKLEKIKQGDISFIDKQLLFAIAKYPKIILQSADLARPSLLIEYLFDLTKKFSEFYEAEPVITAPEGVKDFRIELVKSVKIILLNSGKIIGFDMPEEM